MLRCATAFLPLASLCTVMIPFGEYRRAVLLRSPVNFVECDWWMVVMLRGPTKISKR